MYHWNLAKNIHRIVNTSGHFLVNNQYVSTHPPLKISFTNRKTLFQLSNLSSYSLNSLIHIILMISVCLAYPATR